MRRVGDAMSAARETTPSKGDATRNALLGTARAIVAKTGLDALSINQLAEASGMSKSGVFAHFGSKEELQVGILKDAARAYRHQVIDPAMELPPGRGRLLKFVELWQAWAAALDGGCLFIAGASEFDDRPGPVRDTLARMQGALRTFLIERIEEAAATGELPADTDAAQVAFEIFGAYLALHHDKRLLDDPEATHRAWRAIRARLGLPSEN